MALSVQTLRPLGLGELMDRSLRVWRANLLPLARAMLPYAVISQVVLSLGLHFFAGPEARQLRENPEDLARAFGIMGVMGAASAIAMWLSWLGLVELSRHAYPLFTGAPPRAGAGWLRRQITASRAFVILCLLSLVLSAMALLPVALLFAAILWSMSQAEPSQVMIIVTVMLGMGLLGVVFLVVLFWVILRCYFAAPVLAIETSSLRITWRRCRELISGRIGPGFIGRVPVRASILITVVSAVVFSVQGLASFPMLALQMAFSENVANLSPEAVPLVLRLPAEALVVAIQALSSPIFAVFGMRFYLDQRVRREALDLELALEQRAA